LREEDVIEMKKIAVKGDRLNKFKVIGKKQFGYQEYGGKNWIEEIFGP
jgi:hypothetical protein